jgi:hypothetical protein
MRSAKLQVGPPELARRPIEVTALYIDIVTTTLAGIGINVSPIDPVKALFLGALIIGVAMMNADRIK